MKIYTKTGDDGTTSLFSGGRVPKHHLRVESYGTVDELNSHLGLVRAYKPSEILDTLLENIQNHLFRLGSDLATPLSAKADWLVRLSDEDVTWLETQIDTLSEALPDLNNFVLPGGVPAAAHLHVARTVCRRAERLVTALSDNEEITEASMIYLNRLSDCLFTMARYENAQRNEEETKWIVR